MVVNLTGYQEGTGLAMIWARWQVYWENPFAHTFMASMARISYACVLVEADVSQPLPETIKIVAPSGYRVWLETQILYIMDEIWSHCKGVLECGSTEPGRAKFPGSQQEEMKK